MKPIKVLFTSILILTTLLHANGNSRLPIAKKQFNLTYEDISNDILDMLPDKMFIVDFDITEEGKVENARIVDDVKASKDRKIIVGVIFFSNL